MELIRGLHNLRARHRGCVLTIGNFDGVHLGHRAIIEQVSALGGRTELPATLMSFEPQPQEFFRGRNAPARLTRMREKVKALGRLSVDRLLIVRFDAGFASLSPDDFIERLLVERLGVSEIVVGEDFRFGHGGRGNVGLLREAGRRHAFRVVRQDTVVRDGRRVSSSWVRDRLAAGDFDGAAELLGRRYTMCARVVQGERIGSRIGFPTANLPLGRLVSPLSGVFAVRVRGAAQQALPGVASLGWRPTVDGTTMLLEVHLFDFEGELYGRHLEVDFRHKLREEVRFGSLEALEEQIRRDAEQAKELLLVHDNEQRSADRR